MGRAGLAREAAGTLAIAGILAFLAFGLPAADRQLPSLQAVEAGTPYPVGGPVTVVPPDGTGVDLTRTRPGRDRGTALFVTDSLRLAIVVTSFSGDLDEAEQRLRRKIAATGSEVTGPTQVIETHEGVRGRHGRYDSAGRTGEYAVFLRDSMVVEATASGPTSAYASLAPRVGEWLRSITFGGP